MTKQEQVIQKYAPELLQACIYIHLATITPKGQSLTVEELQEELLADGRGNLLSEETRLITVLRNMRDKGMIAESRNEGKTLRYSAIIRKKNKANTEPQAVFESSKDFRIAMRELFRDRPFATWMVSCAFHKNSDDLLAGDCHAAQLVKNAVRTKDVIYVEKKGARGTIHRMVTQGAPPIDETPVQPASSMMLPVDGLPEIHQARSISSAVKSLEQAQETLAIKKVEANRLSTSIDEIKRERARLDEQEAEAVSKYRACLSEVEDLSARIKQEEDTIVGMLRGQEAQRDEETIEIGDGDWLFNRIKEYVIVLKKRFGFAYNEGDDPYEAVTAAVKHRAHAWGIKEDRRDGDRKILREVPSFTREEVAKIGYKALLFVIDDLAMRKGPEHQMPRFFHKTPIYTPVALPETV